MMHPSKSRIDRILDVHPSIALNDVRLILCHYYKNEWSLPGTTTLDVQNSLEQITLSLIDADTKDLEQFICKLKVSVPRP